MRVVKWFVVVVLVSPRLAGAEEHSEAVGTREATDTATTPDAGFDAEREPPSGTDDDTLPAPGGSDAPIEVAVAGERPLSRDRTQDATLVQGERLRNSARASTFEALSQESADVYVTGRGTLHGVANGASGAVQIRGLGGSPNSQVLVVEDGVPDYQGIFGHPIPDAYVPFLIDDVLIAKGGDSTLYGTNAMGGVILIRTRWRTEDGYEVSSDSGYGSYGTVRQTVSGLARSGGWDVQTGLHALSTEGHRDGAGGRQFVGSAAVRRRFTEDVRLTARNKVVHLNGADPGPATHPTPDHWYDVWRDNASLQLGWGRDPVQLSMTPYFNLGIHELYDGFFSRDYVGGGIADAEIRMSRAAELLVGTAWERAGGQVNNRIESERLAVEGMTSLSTYGQLTVRPVRQVSVVVGGRELYSLRYGSVFLYKAGARYSFYPGFWLRSRVAKNFRQPTIRELYLPFPTANPDLRPEHSLNWDAGLGTVSERFEASCSVYRTEADDMIRYFGSWPSAEVVNIGHVAVWGVEGVVGFKEMGPATVLVTGDWQDVGDYTRQNPQTKLNFTLELGEDVGPDYVGGTVSGEWVHGLYMGDYARDPIDDVFVMDMTLRYRHTSPERGVSLEPYILLRNLLDRRYAYIDGYPMPGFNILAGIKVGI